MITIQQTKKRIRQLLNRDKQDSLGTEYDYRQALLIIANHLNAFISEYGDKTGLSPTQVSQKVNSWDLNQWKQAVLQIKMSKLSPEAQSRYRFYAKSAGINRGYLISAIVGVAFLVPTNNQQARINHRINQDSGDITNVYKVTKKQVNRIIEKNSANWSSDLWLKSDAMTAQVQANVNKKLSSTLTHEDVAKMFDYSNINNQSIQAVRSMASSTDRLLRTESARVVNDVKMAAFKLNDVELVDMVVEPDVCDECDDIHNSSPFSLNEAPDIPIHPNCRCTLIPHDTDDIELSF